MALDAVVMVEAMGRSKFPEFTYVSARDGQPEEVIHDLLASMEREETE